MAARLESDLGARPRVVGYVCVLEADPALSRRATSAGASHPRRRLFAESIEVPVRGVVPFTAATRALFGLLILDGLLLRAVTVARRRTVELLGPGDVVRPWQDDGRLAVLPSATNWTALQTTRIAVLDTEFVTVASCSPEIVEELVRRVTERSHRLAERLALASIPSLPERLLALMWHLAERWGVVLPEGVLIPLPLSHQVLADLACAQRPSVSVALKHLVNDQRAARRPGGAWLLLDDMPARALEPEVETYATLGVL
jgi:CRP/FNR family cyclic AMP-dependent transcriptional regulator